MKFSNKHEGKALKFQKMVLTMQSLDDMASAFASLSAAIRIVKVGV